MRSGHCFPCILHDVNVTSCFRVQYGSDSDEELGGGSDSDLDPEGLCDQESSHASSSEAGGNVIPFILHSSSIFSHVSLSNTHCIATHLCNCTVQVTLMHSLML